MFRVAVVPLRSFKIHHELLSPAFSSHFNLHIQREFKLYAGLQQLRKNEASITITDHDERKDDERYPAGDPSKQAFALFMLNGGTSVYPKLMQLLFAKCAFSMSSSGVKNLAQGSKEVDLTKISGRGIKIVVKPDEKPEWRVVVGVCTHRGGCIHIPRRYADDFDVWGCYCHGFKFYWSPVRRYLRRLKVSCGYHVFGVLLGCRFLIKEKEC